MTFKRPSLLAIFSCVLAIACIAFPALAAVTGAEEVIGQPKDWAFGFQPAASPVKGQMEVFHNHILVPLIFAISIFVLAL
ncbi:MAG TPA: cytochrome c oxidase subunit II transmembrane domain-containing protein, partial [Patescibacteria group bacterium]|nr:cytochrome c oxidase subunit II transmembrane domain-containing protein [Patescibacteria group bacterium]